MDPPQPLQRGERHGVEPRHPPVRHGLRRHPLRERRADLLGGAAVPVPRVWGVPGPGAAVPHRGHRGPAQPRPARHPPLAQHAPAAAATTAPGRAAHPATQHPHHQQQHHQRAAGAPPRPAPRPAPPGQPQQRGQHQQRGRRGRGGRGPRRGHGLGDHLPGAAGPRRARHVPRAGGGRGAAPAPGPPPAGEGGADGAGRVQPPGGPQPGPGPVPPIRHAVTTTDTQHPPQPPPQQPSYLDTTATTPRSSVNLNQASGEPETLSLLTSLLQCHTCT